MNNITGMNLFVRLLSVLTPVLLSLSSSLGSAFGYDFFAIVKASVKEVK